MTIESALATDLRTQLAADATLSALTVPVYPHIAPLSASYPFVIYSIQSGSIENYLNATQANLTLTEVSFDISIHAEQVSDRDLIMTSIKERLHGFAGSLGTENLNVRNIVLQSVSTFSESDITGTDEQVYRASLLFNIHYNWS